MGNLRCVEEIFPRDTPSWPVMEHNNSKFKIQNPKFHERFVEALRGLIDPRGSAPIHLLVAVSGGLDSTVLLHLLRFRSRSLPLELTVAHFDHRMRAGSEEDA